MHFICRSFIGKNSPQNWSQYWENEPDDLDIQSKKGHLFGLIDLFSPEDSEITTTGHNLIDKINQSYFNSESTDVISSLNQTINQVNQLLDSSQLNLTLVIVLDSKIYIVSNGSNKVALNRGPKISLLIKGDQEFNSITGPIIPQDRIFIMTNPFFDQINWDKIRSVLFKENIQNIEEDFMSLLYSIEDQNKLSAALIEVHQDDLPIIDNQDISPPLPPPFTPSPFIKNNESIISEPVKDVESTSPTPVTSLDSVKPVFVENQQPRTVSKRKKIQVYVALALLLGLFVSSYFGYQKNKKTAAENKYQQFKTELESQLNNITLVKSMNLEAAQTGAKESEKIVDQMIKLSIHQDEVNQYKTQINLLLSQTGVNQNYIPDTFFDTSLIINNPQYKDIFLVGSKIYLLDSASGRIDSLAINEKSSKSLLISENIKSATKIFGDDKNLYLLYQDHISQINDSSIDKKISFSELEESITATDIQSWNGSLYLIDSDNQLIWKFTPNSSGFSSPQNWLKNDKKLSLGPISLAIDGEIWVLYQNGLIENYISGVKDNFKLSGSNQFAQTKNLELSREDNGFITFVDNQNIIFIYKKTGDFFATYNLGQLKVLDTVISGNTLYILASDQKIYKISL